ncbi:tape measure protein [Citrobacter sedlakii]|uniref:tape measure protein n=1 Tax=Citrobacter TaxID=544 RepID=UPI001969CB69|nr:MULTISPECIES: tape measure protein [Citrobacter]MBM9570377.1 tape measure protein [Citrobacter sedlakii]HBL4693560.1 tape measure protein [Citrobacter sedlakii]HBL4707997.1 tape measure protein [Citrobacter sedlakii]HBL4722094.1 tape measure protein [Citrobacter sedlakii]HCA7843045.1 tape measure protein [Citrobacter sedlakii]
MTQNVGDIEYVIKADTAQLLRADKQVRDVTDGMEVGFKRADKAASSLTSSFGSLSRVATSLMAILSVQQVSQYADAWTTLNNKLANAIRPSEQLVDVTERVFNITQQTTASLDATATLYARLERGTRQYNTSAEDLAKLTTIINQGFVVSGATAQEAENAIIQLSQGIASGVLRGEEFNSVAEQGSRLMVALADSMGVGIGELRQMAAAGKLTTDVVVNGLLSQGVTIGNEFANTTTTISQALQVAGNNITKFFGENSTVKTGTAIFNDAVISVSENIGALSAILTAAAAVMGSRYVGALTMATAAKVKAAVAARNQSAAEMQAAQAVANKAAADLRAAAIAKERALDEIRLAEMMKQTAVSATNAAAAEQRLSAARVAAAGAVDNYNRALAANKAAQAGLATGAGLVSRGLSLIGGPAGAAMLAASAILYFSQRAKEARDDANNLADSVNELSAKFQTMSHTELAATIGKLSQNLPTLSDAVAEAQKKFNDASYAVSNYNREIERYGNTKRGREATEALAGAQDRLSIATLDLERAQNRLSQTQNAINIGHATLNGTMRQGLPLLQREGEEAGITAGMMGKLGDMINFAAKAKEKYNSSSLMVMRSEDGDKLLSSLEKQNNLLSITDKKERAVAEARQAALDAGVDAHSNQMRQIEEAAAKRYDLQEADSAVTKSTKEGTKAVDEAAQSLSRQQAALDRLNTGYADGSLELAKYDAVVALGNKASAEQIAKAEQQAESIWKVQQATKAAAEEERKRTQAGQNFTGLQGQVSPVAAVDNTYAQQMAQLDEYVQLYPQKIAEAEAVRAGIEDQYHQKRMAAMWEEWQQQSEINNMLGSAIDSLQGGATNAITGLINGTQSLQESFANIGSTILNSVVSAIVDMGVQYVKSLIIGKAMSSAATAAQIAEAGALATAWAPAAMAASIATQGKASAIGLAAYSSSMAAGQALSIAGARRYGGTVSAGNAYRINEDGRSEIFQTAGGQQAFIPNQSGKIIPADKAGGGGSFSPVMNLTINTTGGIGNEEIARLRKVWNNDMLKMMVDQSTRPNGLLQGRRK